MPNIAVSQSEGAFTPLYVSTRAELEALLANPPEADFGPVTIVLKTKVELANLLGALMAYGRGEIYAENGLKAVGLGDYYSGNVRGASRAIAKEVAEASKVVPLPEFSAYLSSSKFLASRKSKAGAAVVGTSEDLAPGYGSTSFESPVAVAEVEYEVEPEEVETEEVW